MLWKLTASFLHLKCFASFVLLLFPGRATAGRTTGLIVHCLLDAAFNPNQSSLMLYQPDPEPNKGLFLTYEYPQGKVPYQEASTIPKENVLSAAVLPFFFGLGHCQPHKSVCGLTPHLLQPALPLYHPAMEDPKVRRLLSHVEMFEAEKAAFAQVRSTSPGTLTLCIRSNTTAVVK